MGIDKTIQNRHSVRKFTSKLPNWRILLECVNAAKYAPMAGNNFTLRFIVITEEEIIQKVAQACDQPFVALGKYIVVVCSTPGRIINAYGKGGEIFARQQAGAAIENFLLKIEEAGLGTCWVGYFDEGMVKRALKIPESAQVEAVFPVGYEEGTSKRRIKPDLRTFLFFNKYGEREMNPEKKQET